MVKPVSLVGCCYFRWGLTISRLHGIHWPTWNAIENLRLRMGRYA
jgi:hypothetical protein